MAITAVTGWKTSDGKFFDKPDDANAHERKLEFRAWCERNICRGGEWSACMVADLVLESWIVLPTKPLSP